MIEEVAAVVDPGELIDGGHGAQLIPLAQALQGRADGVAKRDEELRVSQVRGGSFDQQAENPRHPLEGLHGDEHDALTGGRDYLSREVAVGTKSNHLFGGESALDAGGAQAEVAIRVGAAQATECHQAKEPALAAEGQEGASQPQQPVHDGHGGLTAHVKRGQGAEPQENVLRIGAALL